MKTPESVLFDIFGYTSFREPQSEIINSILRKKHTLAILATGGGKSLCYQIPACLLDGTTIVISPLISLMKDQVAQLNNKIPAEYLNSSQSYNEQLTITYRLTEGKIKLLYISPEKFISPAFKDILDRIKIPLIAVDEAHCISEWGHDFRPGYLKIKEVVDALPKMTIAAFTATATPEVKDDIISKLGLTDTNTYIKGFFRNNLNINVVRTKNKSSRLLELSGSIKGSKIIYCQTRKEVEEINNFLTSKNLSSLPYHAGMRNDQRQLVQDYFISGNAEIIVATNAFGMGINKENIRAVIHYSMPGTLENYYQEIGRAGRDGAESEVFLLYKDSNDRRTHEYFISSSLIDRDLLFLFYEKLNNFYKIEIGDINNYYYPTDLKEIKKILNINLSSGQLNSILNVLNKNKIIKIISSANRHYSVRFLFSLDQLKNYSSLLSVNQNIVIDALIRKFGSLITKSNCSFKFSDINSENVFEEKDFEHVLSSLHNTGNFQINIPPEKESFIFVNPRCFPESLLIDFVELDNISRNNLKKLDMMHKFIKTKDCRWNYILSYFGETFTLNSKCGKCDNCLEGSNEQTTPDLNITSDILKTVKELNGKFGINFLTDILSGAKTKNILEKGLNRISTYGFLKGVPREKIKQEFNALIADGFLEKSAEIYPVISLSAKGESEVSDFIPLIIEKPEKLISESDNTLPELSLKVRLSLYDKLFELRKFLSKKFSQPEFMICSDELLRNISVKAPTTLEELSELKNINQKFILKFGNSIIEVINEFNMSRDPENKKEPVTQLSDSLRTTYNMINSGLSFLEICERRNITDSVISEQIQTLINNKFSIKIETLLATDTINSIRKAIETSNSRFLPVIKKLLPDHISYSEIRIVLAFFGNK